MPRLALSLLGVLLLAKTLVLARAGVEIGAVSWLAYVWQDLAVALVLGAMTAARMSPGLISRWAAYVVAVTYIAINVPVAGVLASPLTWPMIRAARGPLADSIAMYLTAENLGAMAVVLAVAAALPLSLRRLPRVPSSVVAALVIASATGAVLAQRTDTRGFDRNAVTALVTWPRVSAASAPPAVWRDSVFEPPPSSHAALAGAARGMNVLMVILESTGAEYLQLYGAAEDPMPSLGRLGRTSLVFDAAYAVYPESVKGLYAAMCAQSPRFGASMEALLASPDRRCDSPARALSTAGYATALFHSGRFGYLGMDTLVSSLGFDRLEDAGAIGGQVQSSFGVDEAATVARTLSWIDTVSPTTPFFTLYMPAAGHHPYAANIPGPFAGDDELSRYRNAIHETDVALATLLDGLAARGRLDRTMLIIFGDHGEAFGQHPGNAGHTLFIHDENVRVPYLISIPGVTRGERIRAPFSVLDTAPTLLDLVGLPASSDTEGRSLLAPGARIAPFFADYSLGWLGVRDGCWKYQFNVNAAASHLFNVCDDPAESVDRAFRETARVATYRQTVLSWK